jgi:hypothetical protein
MGSEADPDRTKTPKRSRRFSSSPSEAVGGDEEPYSCNSRTATIPAGGIAKGSAKNAGSSYQTSQRCSFDRTIGDPAGH